MAARRLAGLAVASEDQAIAAHERVHASSRHP
jgi:hypothetical protein